jgi:hypothetical protein
MRPTKEQVKQEERFFTFTGDQKDLQKQVEFLSAYFIAKLQILRRSNDYITREQAAEELFYKDMLTYHKKYDNGLFANLLYYLLNMELQILKARDIFKNIY